MVQRLNDDVKHGHEISSMATIHLKENVEALSVQVKGCQEQIASVKEAMGDVQKKMAEIKERSEVYKDMRKLVFTAGLVVTWSTVTLLQIFANPN
jgi:flagellar biosynthesis chaperone FliJ